MLIGDADEEANGEAWKLAVESAGDVKPAIRSNEDVRSLEDEVKAMEDEEVRELEDEVKAMEVAQNALHLYFSPLIFMFPY